MNEKYQVLVIVLEIFLVSLTNPFTPVISSVSSQGMKITKKTGLKTC